MGVPLYPLLHLRECLIRPATLDLFQDSLRKIKNTIMEDFYGSKKYHFNEE